MTDFWQTRDPRSAFFDCNRDGSIIVLAHDHVWAAEVSVKHGWNVMFGDSVAKIRKALPDAVLPSSIGEGDDWPGYTWTVAPGTSPVPSSERTERFRRKVAEAKSALQQTRDKREGGLTWLGAFEATPVDITHQVDGPNVSYRYVNALGENVYGHCGLDAWPSVRRSIELAYKCGERR